MIAPWVILGGLCVTLCAAASANGSGVSIQPSFEPARLGSRSTLSMAVRFSGPQPPLRRALLMFPAGVSVEIPRLRSCSAARLRETKGKGCPDGSRLGSGSAVLQALLGSQLISERVRLGLFIGAPRDDAPSLEILAVGHSPFQRRMVLNATVREGNAPYGEELDLALPPIPTLRYEPDASMRSLELKLGFRGPAGNSVLVPRRCPRGGFPFAGKFTFADGTVSRSTSVVRCPR